MPDFSKSIIYKIQHIDNDNLLYIGSTTNFTKRKNVHKSHCKTSKAKVYEMIRGNGGWYCFKMIVIKEFPCENKRQLEQEEDNIMRQMKSTLNSLRAHITEEEHKAQKAINNKKYKLLHVERLKKQDKEYKEKHKEEIKQKKKNIILKKKKKNRKKKHSKS